MRVSSNLARRLAWPYVAVAMATGVASLIVAAFVSAGRLDSSAFMVVVTAPFLIVGAIVVRREPANPIGWLLLATGVLEIVDSPLGVYGDVHGGVSLWDWAGWVGAWTIPLLLYGPLIFLLLLFPTRRLPFGAARAVVWFAGLALAVDAFAWALARGTLADSELSAANPAGVLPSWVQPVADLGALAAFLAAAAVLVVRLRRSRGVERLQRTWFAYAGSMAGTFLARGILADSAATTPTGCSWRWGTGSSRRWPARTCRRRSCRRSRGRSGCRTPRSCWWTPTAPSVRPPRPARRAASPWPCRWCTAGSGSARCWSRPAPTRRSTRATCAC